MPSILIYISWVLVFILYGLFIKNYFNKERDAILISAGMLLVFLFIAIGVKSNLIMGFDLYFYNGIIPLIEGPLTSIMKLITRLGSTRVLIGIAVTILVIFRLLNYHYYGYMVIVNLVGSYSLTRFLKYSFGRERPDVMPLIEIGGYSFPSGHSLKSISFYGLLFYYLYMYIKNPIYRLMVIVVFTSGILAIGFSRIYLGVHYVSDVLAGFSVGVVWLIVMITLSNHYLEKMSPPE